MLKEKVVVRTKSTGNINWRLGLWPQVTWKLPKVASYLSLALELVTNRINSLVKPSFFLL